MTTEAGTTAAGVTLHGELKPGYDEILTPEALEFIADLHRTFGPRRAELLARREEVQARLDDGWLPDFLPETKHVRDGDWTVAPIPEPPAVTIATCPSSFPPIAMLP